MIAPLVAKEKGFKSIDYRDLIRELKKQQFAGDAILPHYEARMKEIERLIEDRHAARRRRDFSAADRIRDDLSARGVLLEDSPAGTRWKRK